MVSHFETPTRAWRDWALQRLTAVAGVFATLAFIVVLTIAAPINYSTWRQIFLAGWMKCLALLFFISIFVHVWIGMRNIVMDYVKHAETRRILYVLTMSMLGIYVAWAVAILWGRG